VLGVGAALAEGPVWDEREQSLLFVDIVGERVHRFHPSTGDHSSFPAGAPVGAVVLTEDGGLLMALHGRFVHVDRSGEHPVAVEGFGLDEKILRFNDGKADPWGRFLAGTTQHNGSRARGALHMLWPDHTVTTVVDQVTTSNGLAWSADGRTMYYIDTPTHRVDAFDVDPSTGALTSRRPVVEVEDGAPDGMAIDDEGNLWVAIWDGGRVDRYAPDGRLLGVVRVPEGGRVSSVAFGGPSMATLWVTTGRVGLSDTELALNPHAGDIFAYEAPVTGPAAFRFSGSPPA
jgi:sugar lactone lactonase YvrE